MFLPFVVPLKERLRLARDTVGRVANREAPSVAGVVEAEAGTRPWLSIPLSLEEFGFDKEQCSLVLFKLFILSESSLNVTRGCVCLESSTFVLVPGVPRAVVEALFDEDD